jgi:mRNA interferase RelE/StbE
VKFSDQVSAALKSLHPDTRREIRRALSDLEAGKKRDTKALKAPLHGFSRLRVGKYRVIYRHDPEGNSLIAEFLDGRSTVYEKFEPPS